MPITRTPMVDDDGDGTTGTILNNAWKQELYSQIDGVVGREGTWTAVDASGAGLVLGNTLGTYVKVGKLVVAQGRVDYPTTASSAQALIGGLPFTVGTSSGGGVIHFCTTGVPVTLFVNTGATTFLVDDYSGAALTNTQLSTKIILFTVIYVAVA